MSIFVPPRSTPIASGRLMVGVFLNLPAGGGGGRFESQEGRIPLALSWPTTKPRTASSSPPGRPTTRCSASGGASSRACASPMCRAFATCGATRETARGPRAGGRFGGRLPRPGSRGKRILKWVGIAAAGWIVLSFLAFAVSAQLQAFKLSGEAKEALHGSPFLLTSAQTILVIGTDARPPDTKEPGAAPSQECFDQQSHGDAPHGKCSSGEFRADTLMLIRAGGGSLPQTLDPARQLRRNPRPEPAEDQRRLRLRRRQAADRSRRRLPRHRSRPRRDHRLHRLRRPDRRGRRGQGRRPAQALHRHRRRRRRRPGRLHPAARQGREHPRRPRGADLRPHPRAERMPRARARAPTRSATTTTTARKPSRQVINGIKDRLTDPLRLPYNFIKGPIIGWDAPKAFVSDMGFFTMPQLVLAAAIGGSGPTDVLCTGALEGCETGPAAASRSPSRCAARPSTGCSTADQSAVAFGLGVRRLRVARRGVESESLDSRPRSRLASLGLAAALDEPPCRRRSSSCRSRCCGSPSP